LRKDNYRSTLKPEGSLLSRVFNQIVGPRRSQGEMDLSLKREVAWGTRKTFLFLMVLMFHSLFSTSSHTYRFLVLSLPFVNLGMIFLLRERVVTPRVMTLPNYLH
jgi:hypothetical protein